MSRWYSLRMSLREELTTRASVLEHANCKQVTIWLAKLLRWMNEQPEIKPVLQDLKLSGPVYQRLNLGPHPQARPEALLAVETEKDLAAVGLAMMELCAMPRGRDEFHQIAHSFGLEVPPGVTLPQNHLRDTAMKQYVQPLLNYVMKHLPEDTQAGVAVGSKLTGPAPSETPTGKNPQTVFVIHGRNEAVRKSMFEFLRAIGLKPLEWSQAIAETKEASPYIGQVLDAAFRVAQAVVVLMTPDDQAWLGKEFQTPRDESYEKQPTGQARPNVLFEAGMAMGRDPKRTVLVQVGDLRPFSDVGGRYVVRLDDSSERRHDLAERLRTAGCAVDLSGRDWHKAGSFKLEPTQTTSSPVTNEIPGDGIPSAALDEVQVNVLRMLSEVDGEPVPAEKLAEALGLPVSKLKYIADRLEKAGYLDKPVIVGGGTQYALDDKGRAYLVENNLL